MSPLARSLWFGVLCCLLAFGLGVSTLGTRYLWGDEAFSVFASRQPIWTLLGGFDAQPPLYYLALRLTRALWGETEFALRFFSLCCTVAWVAVGVRLARAMFAVRAARVAGLALATAPLAIYFAQEVRMYAPAALCSAALMWITWQMRRRMRSWRAWVAYAAVALAGLLTHYYTAGVLLASAIALGALAWRQRCVGRWLITHAVIALIFGGWFAALQRAYLLRASATSARQITATAQEIAANFVRGSEGLVFGPRADGSLAAPALVLVALAVVGAARWGRRAPFTSALIVGWMVASFALVLFTASPSAIVSDFHPRYLLFALLPLVLGLASWAAWLRTRGVALMMALVLAVAAFGNYPLLFDVNWQKSRYAELMQTLRSRYRAGDVIVMLNSDQVSFAAYYAPPPAPVWVAPNDALDEDATHQSLRAFVSGATRAWVIRFGWAMALSPEQPPLDALTRRGVRTFAQGFQDADLLLYDLRVGESNIPPRPLDVRFGPHIRLIGVRERRAEWQPGEALTLDLIWRADATPEADYTVFMHLRRADDGVQIAALDSPPSRPTSTWQPGEVITDTRAVPIPTDAPAGRYRVVIGWYAYPSFERLALADGVETEYVVSEPVIR